MNVYPFLFFRYVSRVSINGKEVSAMGNIAGTNDFRSSSTSQNPLRYPTSNWKNSSGASSGASTGVSPIHSSNEDHNGDDRYVFNAVYLFSQHIKLTAKLILMFHCIYILLTEAPHQLYRPENKAEQVR